MFINKFSVSECWCLELTSNQILAILAQTHWLIYIAVMLLIVMEQWLPYSQLCLSDNDLNYTSISAQFSLVIT